MGEREGDENLCAIIRVSRANNIKLFDKFHFWQVSASSSSKSLTWIILCPPPQPPFFIHDEYADRHFAVEILLLQRALYHCCCCCCRCVVRNNKSSLDLPRSLSHSLLIPLCLISWGSNLNRLLIEARGRNLLSGFFSRRLRCHCVV